MLTRLGLVGTNLKQLFSLKLMRKMCLFSGMGADIGQIKIKLYKFQYSKKKAAKSILYPSKQLSNFQSELGLEPRFPSQTKLRRCSTLNHTNSSKVSCLEKVCAFTFIQIIVSNFKTHYHGCFNIFPSAFHKDFEHSNS